jgi:4-amino-4-deoxy-L-arabinose transferase-like glycosyltransferase
MDRLIDTLSRSHARALAVLFVLALAFFIPGQFTLQPMDRDEPRFAQASKQMLETGDYVDIRFQDEARHKKPVGIYWLQTASVKLAELAGFDKARDTIGFYRIPSFLGALAVVALSYWAALAFLARPGALMAAALMAASILLGVEARLAKTDAVLAATVVAAMGALARYYFAHVSPDVRGLPGRGTFWVFWLAIAFGVLIKGPITPLIPLIAALILSWRERSLAWLKPLKPLQGLAIVLVIALPWLLAIAIKSGGAFFAESVGKDMLGKVGGVAEKHWGPPGAYFIAFWATFWPAAPLVALTGWFWWSDRRDDAVVFLLSWILPLWLVLEAMPTKLPHYVLPLYPAIAILVMMAVERRAIPYDGWRLPVSAALMLLIPLGLFIGAPLAFWWFDRTLPLAAMPLLGLATVLAAVAARSLWQGEVRGALLAGLIAALPLSAAAFRLGVPELKAINLSRELAGVARTAGCERPAFATAGYREPSLVFLTATSLRMGEGADMARFLYDEAGGCRIAFIEGRQETAFTAELPPGANAHRLVGRVRGININGGRPLDIGVWMKR